MDDNADTEQVVRALDIPIVPNTLHEYNVDWENLSSETGVVVRVDSNGDGVFEKAVIGGTNLTADDFTSNNVNSKAYICHAPPDNPKNAKTHYLSAGAILDHLEHGDILGKCKNI